MPLKMPSLAGTKSFAVKHQDLAKDLGKGTAKEAGKFAFTESLSRCFSKDKSNESAAAKPALTAETISAQALMGQSLSGKNLDKDDVKDLLDMAADGKITKKENKKAMEILSKT